MFPSTETARFDLAKQMITSSDGATSSNGDTMMYHQELSKVLDARYVLLAFNLPPGCSSIWNMLREDIDNLGWQDQPHILEFLSNFFSENMVKLVGSNLVALKESFLTIDYMLGQGNRNVAMAIVDGILEEAGEEGTPLAHFLGQVSEHDEEEIDMNEGWQLICTLSAAGDNEQVMSGNNANASQENRESENENSNNNAGADSFGRGSTGDAAGASGSGGSIGPQVDLQHFPTIQDSIILIHLPAFVTPPRGFSNRSISIKERSALFWNEAQKCCRGLRLYDPRTEQGPGGVSLLHGTRTSSLPSFQIRGILPNSTARNDFSQLPAFYVTNSMRHAFERPLLFKPGRNPEDHISVMEFFVNVDILHGKQPPLGQSTCFDVRWFRQPSRDWKQFCIGNMANDLSLQALAPLHSHDIVIGPVCRPLDWGRDMDVVADRVGRSRVYVNQVAFCTPRSWSWLESCLKRVFEERRDAS